MVRYHLGYVTRGFRREDKNEDKELGGEKKMEKQREGALH